MPYDLLGAADAIRIAIDALKSQEPTRLDAIHVLQSIVEQRGCEDLDPAASRLTDLIDNLICG